MDAPLRSLSPVWRRVLRGLTGACVAGLGAFALQTVVHPFGDGATRFFENWIYNGVILFAAASCLARAAVVRAERVAWLFLGAGLAAWGIGEIYYSVALEGLRDPPYPSLTDLFSILFYPASYVALALLLRARVRDGRASVWLDGMLAALGAAAIAAATLFEPVLHSTSGTALTAATDLAYPLGDLTLLAFIAAVMGVTGWRPGRDWSFIGAGLAATAVGDGIFLYMVAQGTYTDGSWLDVLWPAATLLLAWAAWQPSRRSRVRLDGWLNLLVPSVFALAAVGLLVYSEFSGVPAIAVGFAAATMVAAILRMALTFRENLRMVAASRSEAMTDPLTGLGNRRKLMEDLREEAAHAPENAPRVLAIFDLDGFKRYNDIYGHPAGDALLARLGHNLEASMRPYGRAYRLGGDEFCTLVKAGPPGVERILAAAVAALSDHGRGFEVASSHGMVVIPQETRDAAGALRIADQRLYAVKGSRHNSAATQQTQDVLLQMLLESQPELREHLERVAHLARDVGRRVGLRSEELEETARAAELHDVGKMAIPESILSKPGPLDEAEWRLMRQHTVIGQRILSAAPAMAGVAKLVRASHEHWDGSGYPDGLAGEEIPLGARVVAVCDAFHAMTSPRPYQRPFEPEVALAELRTRAGTQFDPRVVRAFCQEVAENGAWVPGAQGSHVLGSAALRAALDAVA